MSAENPEPEDNLTWIVAIIGILLFLVLAYATMIMWNAANPLPEITKQAFSPDSTGAVTPAITVCPQQTPSGNHANVPEIAIDPVPNHALGDIITFTGTTNLAEGELLELKINSAEFVPCPKGLFLPDSVNPCGEGFAGTVSVRWGNCGVNTWSWSVDTSQHGFQPGGQYILVTNGGNGQVQNYTLFNITGSQR